MKMMTTKNSKWPRPSINFEFFKVRNFFFKWKFFFDATSSFQKNEFKTFFSRFEVFQFSRLVPCMTMHGPCMGCDFLHGPCMGSHGTSVRVLVDAFFQVFQETFGY